MQLLKRIAVAGGPRTGKTTFATGLSEQFSIPMKSTDDWIDLGWGNDSDAAAEHMLGESFIVEGVAVARALRKLLKTRPGEKVVDILHVLDKPVVPTSKGQDSMGKGCRTVLNEILPELSRRGIQLVFH